MPRIRLVLFGVLLVSHPIAAQTPAPAPPVHGMTIRASRADAPLRIDGRLDEPIYAAVAPFTNFIQTEPSPGAPATEKTEAWLLFDDDYVYVTLRCWDSHPERRVANDMRRDTVAVSAGNDNVAFMFDTFHDRRNA